MSQQPLTLTRPQKAAAILVAMGKPSASRLLKFFKQEELKALIEGARLLRTIPQADLDRIVAEFEAEFTEGAGLLDSADEMDTILNESLSPEEMNAIMNGTQQQVAPEQAPPIWPELERLDPARLGAFLAGEHAQTAAMVLSKLAPQAAAKVLLVLDKPLRVEVMKRMMTLTSVPEAAERIVESQLRSRVLTEGADRAAPGQRPGADAARNLTVVATVQKIDRNANVITVRGPSRTVDVAVEDPKLLEGVKVGDTVTVNYTEAVALAVTQAPDAKRKWVPPVPASAPKP